MPKKQFHSSETPSSTITEKPKIPMFVKIGVAVLVLLVLAVVGAAGYHYYTFQQKVNAQITPPTEPQELIKQVSKLMELPLNETPQIATVSDIEKLKDQPFFANAQNGDKVLIYQNAKKAILYRPETKKIVEVGPVNIDPNQTATASDSGEVAGEKTETSPTEAPSIEIEIYNGTKRSGLARSARTKVSSGFKQGEVVGTGNSTNDYKETIVIDLSQKNAAAAQSLAKIVGGKVAPFPKGESSSSADILIILGDNYETE